MLRPYSSLKQRSFRDLVVVCAIMRIIKTLRKSKDPTGKANLRFKKSWFATVATNVAYLCCSLAPKGKYNRLSLSRVVSLTHLAVLTEERKARLSASPTSKGLPDLLSYLQFVPLRHEDKIVDNTILSELVRELGNRHRDCRLPSPLNGWGLCSILFLISIEYKQ